MLWLHDKESQTLNHSNAVIVPELIEILRLAIMATFPFCITNYLEWDRKLTKGFESIPFDIAIILT